MYETAEAKKYKKDFALHIREQVKKQGYSLVPNKMQHFYVDCIFFFDRVDKDPNNYFKLLLDAITDTQLIWIDDNIVCERVQAIYYDTANPRIELTICPVDYIGVFDNQEQLEQFESNCTCCTRYKGGRCSILNKAVEGRIQDEVAGLECKKFKLKG